MPVDLLYLSSTIKTTYKEPYFKFSSFLTQLIQSYWHLKNKKLKKLKMSKITQNESK